jgi:general secretion pathway protein G
MRRNPLRQRKGFSLVELVVVVLIMGIIAGVAIPKLMNTTQNAKDNSAKQSLMVLRNAVELYMANNGSYPGSDETTFKAAVQPYLKGPFPTCPVVNANASVRVVTGDSLPLANSVGGTQGWAYNNQTGEVIINAASYSQF